MYESALKLLNQIANYGYEAYIVGGYPRDLKLNRKTNDVDICTDATPMELMGILDGAETDNSEYGSIIFTFEKVRFEITTFRREKEYSGYRKPIKIEYIDRLDEDLLRRDFTINTLCIDKKGKEIDLLGANKDIETKIIKMVGDPKVRLKEDALRILRAVRFATVLDFEMDKNLKIYIKKYAHLLKKISYERKKDELDLIFSNSNKEKGIKLLNELKLIDALEIPKLKKIKITPSLLVTWALLDVQHIYPFTSNEKELIIKINELKDKNVLDKKVLYKYGLYVCTLAAELQDIPNSEVSKLYNDMSIHNKLEIALKPVEICNLLNKEPGKFLKEIINDLEEKILCGVIKNDKKEIEDYILKKFKET